MFNYLVRRILSGVVVLGIVSAIVFGIFYILPADPARLSCGKTCSEELILKIRHTLELDQTLPVQYGRYVKGIFVGRTYLKGSPAELKCSAPCLGYSFQTNQPVTQLLKDRLPATASIAFFDRSGAILTSTGVDPASPLTANNSGSSLSIS